MKMSTTTSEVRAKITFEDGTTRTYAIPIEEADKTGVKSRVQELNSGTGAGTMYKDKMLATFVSDTGSPMVKIGAVNIVTETEEVIYSG